MHALARAPSFRMSTSPAPARRRRTRRPAQAASSSAKPPSRPEQTTAMDAPARSSNSSAATTTAQLTYEARMRSRCGPGDGAECGVRGLGEGGRVEAEGGGTGKKPAAPAAAIAAVPLVVVQMMSLPCTTALVNSLGELPSSKPSGLTALRSPARRADGRPWTAERASSTVVQGMMLRAPLARAYAALDVKRRTSIMTTTSARLNSGRK
jgi:hypothetical protein